MKVLLFMLTLHMTWHATLSLWILTVHNCIYCWDMWQPLHRLPFPGVHTRKRNRYVDEESEDEEEAYKAGRLHGYDASTLQGWTLDGDEVDKSASFHKLSYPSLPSYPYPPPFSSFPSFLFPFFPLSSFLPPSFLLFLSLLFLYINLADWLTNRITNWLTEYLFDWPIDMMIRSMMTMTQINLPCTASSLLLFVMLKE